MDEKINEKFDMVSLLCKEAENFATDSKVINIYHYLYALTKILSMDKNTLYSMVDTTEEEIIEYDAIINEIKCRYYRGYGNKNAIFNEQAILTIFPMIIKDIENVLEDGSILCDTAYNPLKYYLKRIQARKEDLKNNNYLGLKGTAKKIYESDGMSPYHFDWNIKHPEIRNSSLLELTNYDFGITTAAINVASCFGYMATVICGELAAQILDEKNTRNPDLRNVYPNQIATLHKEPDVNVYKK